MRSKTTKTWWVGCTALLCTFTTIIADQRPASRFRPDDPVAVDNDTAIDAGRARRDRLGSYADFLLNTFMRVGDARPIPAINVNSLGEVPDSSWFTNRSGQHALSLDDIVRGPDRVPALAVRRWSIVAGKDTGRQAGFRAVDADNPGGSTYQIEFDPVGNPEMATGAEVIGTALYHALGYNVVDVYLIDLDPAAIAIAPGATVEVAGRSRPFTRRDLEQVLRRAARKSNGHYRASASRFADGQNLGPFRYYGTRPDDPNDVYPHEHRRELRGNRVMTAWLNHDDSRAINTLDMLVGPSGQQHVKHYMFDFGSIMGSGTNEEDQPWVGHEYVVQGRPALLTLASLGLWRRPFIAANAPRSLPAAGNFTDDGFNPADWRPHYRNAAFANMQPEDAFWAARLVATLTPASVERIVRKAQFSDPNVVDHITGTLLRRREQVLRTWLTGINPVAAARIDKGSLRFDNVAADAGVASVPDSYELTWFRFDNATDAREMVGRPETVTSPSATVPVELLSSAEYVGVQIRTAHPGYSLWRAPVHFFFRSDRLGWTLVGVERSAADAATLATSR